MADPGRERQDESDDGYNEINNGEQEHKRRSSSLIKIDRPIDPKLEGLSQLVSSCLMKSLRIASELNHAEASSAHLIVAMTLISAASQQLASKNIDIEGTWRAAMATLVELDRVDVGYISPGISDELAVILREAAEVGKKREGQDAVIGDILAVLLSLPADSAVRQLISGRRSATAAEEARDAVRKLEENMSRQLDGIRTMLKGPEGEQARSIGRRLFGR